MNPGIQDRLILELPLSSGEGFLEIEGWVKGSLPLDRFLYVGGRSLIWWPWTRRSCSRCAISSKRKKIKKTHTTDRTQRKGPWWWSYVRFRPDDALLARGVTYQKKKISLLLWEENRWFDRRTTWEIRDLGKPLHFFPLPLNDRRTTYLLLDSSRSVRIYGQSIGPRIYSSIR